MSNPKSFNLEGNFYKNRDFFWGAMLYRVPTNAGK